MITAKLSWHKQEIEAEVINPGDWFGRPWLVEIDCGYSRVFYVVESGSFSDVFDDFADSEKSHHITIDPEDYGDYGEFFHPGNWFHGKEITKEGWYDLNGHYSESELSSYHIADNGKPCNLDDLRVYGLDPTQVRYHGADLPAKGVRADRYCQYQDWLATR